MANALKLATATAQAEANALLALFNGGSIFLYDGTRPTDANTAVGSQVLLATVAITGTPCTATGGVVSFTGQSFTGTGTAEATAPGKLATWFRYKTSGAATIVDGTVGTSGCDLNLGSATISTGGIVTITAFSHTVPLV